VAPLQQCEVEEAEKTLVALLGVSIIPCLFFSFHGRQSRCSIGDEIQQLNLPLRSKTPIVGKSSNQMNDCSCKKSNLVTKDVEMQTEEEKEYKTWKVFVGKGSSW
jgi:hypothetical protein